MILPQAFVERMKGKLGERFPDFLRSYDLPARKGIRVNTLKLAKEEFMRRSPYALRQVPWEENGFYIDGQKVGGDPYHFAGLFYSQEPSAMCAVPMLGVKPGDRVLDLCAAPGGKSTQLAQAMKGEGVLVANEYVFERARILLQNLERLGVKNSVVASSDSGFLAEQMPCWFDKILVDAPCSGEGMFKKEPAALQEWSEENIARCCVRQAEILDNAARMLRGGGRMVYSTCTFSEEENEGQISAFLRRHPEFALLETRRLMPHEICGEGHFSALLEKREETAPLRTREFRNAPTGALLRAFTDFCKDFFVEEPAYRLYALGGSLERLYALPEGAFRISCLNAGLFLGGYENKVFKPSHALAMSVKREEVRRFVSLSREESDRYLRGETVESSLPNGWCVVGVEDYPLGIGKIVNGVVKNHLPKGLRKVK